MNDKYDSAAFWYTFINSLYNERLSAGKVIQARYGKVHSPEAWAAKLEELVATHLGLC